MTHNHDPDTEDGTSTQNNVQTTTVTIDGESMVNASHLNAAVEALGQVMLEMGRRQLLLRPHADAAKRLLNQNVRSDAELLELSSQAFEAGAMELARVGYPGAAVHLCNPGEPSADQDPDAAYLQTTLEPLNTEPASTEPASTEPASTEPASTEPASTEPASPALINPAHLNTAVKALGKVILEMGRRQLLLRPRSDAAKRLLNQRACSDADLLELSSQAFEAAVTELARIGYPSADDLVGVSVRFAARAAQAVHSCNLGGPEPDEPPNAA